MSEAIATHEGEHHNSTGIDTRKLLMWIFLGSDCLFFGSFIATYLVYRNRSLVGPYPNEILDIPITTVSTFVLLMSSLAMVLALNYTQRGKPVAARYWTLATAGLGAIFLGFQVYEFNHFVNLGLTPRTNMFGTTFFVLTGFHGAHVTFGVLWLLTFAFSSLTISLKERAILILSIIGFLMIFFATLMRDWLHVIPHIPLTTTIAIGASGALILIISTILLRKNSISKGITESQSMNLELSGLYWHFVDIVWIVIFTIIYLVSAKDVAPIIGM